jgi:cyanophycin synthetase
MCQLADRLEVSGRRICVLSAPGDRRDEDIAEVGRIAAGHFDHYICRRDDQLRGRQPDEVPALLKKALENSGVPPDEIDTIPEEQLAVHAALSSAAPGDLVLIFADAITRSWKQVIQFRPDAAPQPLQRPRTSRPEPAPVIATPLLEDRRREFVRDSRGVRIARAESED